MKPPVVHYVSSPGARWTWCDRVHHGSMKTTNDEGEVTCKQCLAAIRRIRPSVGANQ